METILLYISLFTSVFALIVCLYVGARLGNFIKDSMDLDWHSIANITGDLATLKKTIQTLNNRINGMHSPKVMEQELMMQMLNNQQKKAPTNNVRNIGG
jgi:hypothetical protein